jgi:hypothetical protein
VHDRDYNPARLMDDRSTVYVEEAQGAKDGEPDLIPFLDADELAWVRDAKGASWASHYRN